MCSTAVVEEPENMSFSNFLGNVHSILCKINWIMIATCIWGCNTINFMKDEKIAKMEKKLTKMLKMEKNLWSKNLYNRLGNMMVGRVNENTGVLAAVVTLVREKNAKNAKNSWFWGVFLTFFGHLVPILSRNMLREGPKTKYTTRRTSWAVITRGGTKKFGQVCSRCPKLGRICYFWKMVNLRRLYLLNALTQNF